LSCVIAKTPTQDRRRFPILLLEPGILKALAEKPEADLIRFGIGGEDAR
jgi:hypothetical protein